MGLSNPLTAKEKLQAARATASCSHDCQVGGWLSWEFVPNVIHDHHGVVMSLLLDGLSVHEVTMAELELDEEACLPF